MRHLLQAHAASLVVTAIDPRASDGIVICSELASKLALQALERVELANERTGARLSVPVARGQVGRIAVAGPAALFFSVGDRVSLSAYCWLKPKAAARHRPRIVYVDDDNKVIRVEGGDPEPSPDAPKKPKKSKKSSAKTP